MPLLRRYMNIYSNIKHRLIKTQRTCSWLKMCNLHSVCNTHWWSKLSLTLEERLVNRQASWGNIAAGTELVQVLGPGSYQVLKRWWGSWSMTHDSQTMTHNPWPTTHVHTTHNPQPMRRKRVAVVAPLPGNFSEIFLLAGNFMENFTGLNNQEIFGKKVEETSTQEITNAVICFI